MEELLIRLIAIFAFLIFLIVFIAPSIGQQTAADWLNNGQKLTDQGKYGEAIRAYDQSIMLDPQNAEAWYGKGLALWAEGKSDEARSAFEKATTLDPSLSGPETYGTGPIYGPTDGTGSIYGLTPYRHRLRDLRKYTTREFFNLRFIVVGVF